ncbi:alpha-glucosidase C-terminal domain-containing protein [Pontibacter sp. BT310]|uniref:Alpha-glucosidase C-terminal domain-containing protein n=1 Tax=Pontibacter populi TaxID=890055 RepID=A0ABS6X5Y1_9BACT|nr:MULTISPECIES: alpha-amylase family glycosyl hydrolase [Pontibacter]MBJ6116560.1 alpha-glucosidase C-terminal domain-containing protein [Pontibacter sp. BT310]MBR0568984.1 alpha-glucosidase C-terminal domain-containing protein [Microvirga sp. STS03]MBW3363413.1 alpha-glucosidase C-terminal domain-containing protein [Pontibacter populi]
MKNLKLYHLLPAAALLLASACSSPSKIDNQPEAQASNWPNGVTYEIFVQSFCDSDNDGIGDIKGMTSKLDYLADLGVTGVWLMPMSPSPSYHKYDVTDYYGIHPDYGTMEDFKEFVAEAHKRNINVVIDLVLNHSGNGHPWFKEAAKDENSKYRDYYVWAHKDDSITKGEGKTTGADSYNVNHWHSVPGSDYKYFGYFWGGMPDLNFDNPIVRQEAYKIGRFWLKDVGVDGFRLDAARHIFTDDRQEDNHKFWEEFKAEMQKVKPDVYLVGEVWATADVAAPYIKGLPALFNFEMSWAILKALNQGTGDSLAIKHANIAEAYKKVNPAYVDATILSNHDQNRIMSEVSGDMNKAKLAAALLLTLPGSPYIYYGEEIGMKGKKPDEEIREPFLWDVQANDECRTSWMTPKNTTEQTVTPVAVQLQDKASILNLYKSLIKLRNSSAALTSGTIEPVTLENKAISAFVRAYKAESVLVLHNLSGSTATISLPAQLANYKTTAFHHNDAKLVKNTVELPAYSTVILQQ